MNNYLPIARLDPRKPAACQDEGIIYNKYSSSPCAVSASSYSFRSVFRCVILFVLGLPQNVRMLS